MKKGIINTAILVLICFATEAQELEWARFHSLNTDISKVTQLVYPKLAGNIILSPDIDLPSPQKTIDYYLNKYKLIERQTTIFDGKERTVLFSYNDDIIVSRVDATDTLNYSFDYNSQLYTSYRLSDLGVKNLHSKIKHNDKYLIEEYESYMANEIQNRSIYTYNDQELLVTRKFTGQSNGSASYEYDLQGRLLKEMKSSDNGNSVTVTSYPPDQIIRKRFLDDKLVLRETVDIKSEYLRVITYMKVDHEGQSKLHHMKYEKRNKNGNLIFEMDYLPLQVTEVKEYIYTY